MQPYTSISFPFQLEDFDLIIDARSPVEFEEDSLPNAVNLPVLDNNERKKIGTDYRKNAFEATRDGAALISQNIAKHLNSDLKKISQDTKILVYCWRGNMRSKSFATILGSIGWDVTYLEGGYRHFRNFIIQDTERLLRLHAFPFHIITGLTGSGKTHFIKALKNHGEQVLDLEEIANHRGSLFGFLGKQPSQKKFETKLWEKLRHFDSNQPVFVESESNRIGNVFCPASLWKAIKGATVSEIKMPLESRVQVILQDYPHLLEEPDTVILLIEKLRRLCGNDQVNEWLHLTQKGKWEELIQSLLLRHYDRAYKPAGSEKSIYAQPSHFIELNDHLDMSFKNAVAAYLHALRCP